jgi:hypothetical protein
MTAARMRVPLLRNRPGAAWWHFDPERIVSPMNNHARRAVLVLLWAVCAAALSEPAQAQSCGGSAGPSMTCGAPNENDAWLASGRFALRLSHEYEHKDGSFKGSRRVTNDFNESLFINRTALQARVGVTDEWTADLTATYVRFTYRLKPPFPFNVRTEQEFDGLGDTFLLFGRRVDVAPARGPHDMSPAPQLSLWGGVALPTGSPEKPDPFFVTRDVSVANLQTGTGTFDPLLRARLEWPRDGWTFFSEAAVRFPVYENRYRYRTGDVETLAVGGAVAIVPRLSASLTLTAQRVARDTFDGDDVGVGGARWLFVGPGIAWSITDDATLDFGVRVPVMRRTETKLSDSKSIWQIGLSWRF